MSNGRLAGDREAARADEPTQASIVAVLRHLAGEPLEEAGEAEPIAEDEFPWRWSGPEAVELGLGAGPGGEAKGELVGDAKLEPLPHGLPSVAYLLPGLPPEGSGGSHSLAQEARGMRALGAEAKICVPADSLQTAARVYGNEDALFATYRGDARFPGVSDSSLTDAVADADVAVATEYPSVELLARVAHKRPDLVCAYYVQDYEPLFAAPETSKSDRALLSYRAIPGQVLFAKTHWLCNIVSELHGLPVAKVRPSLDRELFHARGRVESANVIRVAAMIRPRTPRRRPATTLAALARIGEELGEAAHLVTFGCDESSFVELQGGVARGVSHLGLLGRGEVAELMRRCDVFIDASAYQAFGRTGFEAMACGAVPVLPALGGVREFAVDDENALILGGASEAAIARAVIELAHDRPRLEAMRDAGVIRAQEFSVERAARSQLDLFSSAVESGIGVALASP